MMCFESRLIYNFGEGDRDVLVCSLFVLLRLGSHTLSSRVMRQTGFFYSCTFDVKCLVPALVSHLSQAIDPSQAISV